MKKMSIMKCKKFVTYAKENHVDKNDENAFKLYHKVKDHCHYTGKFNGAADNICNLRYKTPKKKKRIPLVFDNGSTYNYHFVIKQLAKEFKDQFKFLGENTHKYITFLVLISKELDNGKTITKKLKFIDNFRFTSTSLSSLVDNSSEIYNKKCRDKNCKSECKFLKLKNYRLQYKCYECKKIYLKPINEIL